MMYDKEKELIILLSRIYDIEFYEKPIREILKDRFIHWDVVIKYLCKTKVMGLFWYNITKLKMDNYIPANAKRILEFYYLGNYERNKILMKEFERIEQILVNNDIKVAPLKGIVLLKKIYKDFGLRQLNDIDLLVSYKEKDRIEEVFLENGYKHGSLSYDKEGNLIIEKLDRMQEIIWKTKMNNLPPFYKVTNQKWCNIIDIDCCFAFDYRMNYDHVADIMDNLCYERGTYFLQKEDFFIQMCCHLYKEASNASWVLLGSDLNLMKFCDVREFLNTEIDKQHWAIVCEKAIKDAYNKAIYFALYYCEKIYGEKCRFPYKLDLHIEDESFIHEYGKREYGEKQTWKTEFMERLFEGSMEEIEDKKGKFALINGGE